MKILIATGLYPPDMGGPATYTVFLEKHLPRFGIEYVVVAYTSVRKFPKIIRHFVYMMRLIKASRNVDFLYALDTVSVGLPVRIISFLTRKPYMLRVPGDYAWEQGQQRYGITETLDEYLAHHKKHFMVRIMAMIQKHVALHARHIVVPSEYLKSVVMLWGISSDRITRIYSILKVLEVAQSKESLRTEFGYTSLVIATAGRLVPWKGVHGLVEVVAKLRQAGVDVQLEILGDGPCRAELEELARSLNIAVAVHFRGVLPRDEMARRIKASDIFVLNTSYEGLSHQLIEVMSLDTPIITTRVGGNPELITDGKTGTLIAYNDTEALHAKILEFRTNPTSLNAFVTEAHKQTELFHEDRVVPEFITLIRTLWK